MLNNFPTQKDVSWYRHAGTAIFTCFYALGPVSQPFGGMATVTPAINTLYAIPFMTGRGGVVDRLAFEVTTGGAVGSVARMGLYTNVDDPDVLYPNRLIVDGGEQDTTTVAVKTSTVSVTMPQATVYWAVLHVGVAAPVVRGLLGLATNNMLGYPSTIGGTPYTELTFATAYAALPATFPSGALPASASIPLLTARYSS